MKKRLILCVVFVLIAFSVATATDMSLHFAAQNGDLKRIREVLAKKRRLLTTKDSSGDTALHWGVRRGQYYAVKLLIFKGADVNAKNKAGRTPLDDAIKYKRTKIAQYLKSKGGVANKEKKVKKTGPKMTPAKPKTTAPWRDMLRMDVEHESRAERIKPSSSNMGITKRYTVYMFTIEVRNTQSKKITISSSGFRCISRKGKRFRVYKSSYSKTATLGRGDEAMVKSIYFKIPGGDSPQKIIYYSKKLKGVVGELNV